MPIVDHAKSRKRAIHRYKLYVVLSSKLGSPERFFKPFKPPPNDPLTSRPFTALEMEEMAMTTRRTGLMCVL